MRIALVSIYRPESETGVAKTTERLARQLSVDHDVIYVCLGQKYTLEKKGGIKYLLIPSIPFKQGFVPKLTRGIVEKLFNDLSKINPDVVHAQNIVFSALIAQVWALQNHKPYLLTLHSQPTDAMDYILPSVKSVINYSPPNNYLKIILKYTDLVISLNESTDKSVRQVNRQVKIKRIANGLDLNKYQEIPVKKQSKIINCVYLGMYMRRKNQEFLVKVFSYLPNIYQLNLYGNISTGRSYVKKLKRLIGDLEVTNVHLNGYVSSDKVRKILKSSDYFVSASTKEVQSLSVIEALASGTPVIGLDNETLSEVVNGNGLKMSSDITAKKFADNLKSYVERSRSNYLEIANNAKNSAQKFNIVKVSNELTDTYQSLLDKPRKVEVNTNQLSNLIPDQFRELFPTFIKSYGKVRRQRMKRYLYLTVIFSTLIWPVAYVVSVLRKNSNKL